MDKVYRISEQPITAQSISDAIKFNQELALTFEIQDQYYRGIHDVLRRKKSRALKNRIAIANHAKYIVDMNVGYLLGEPVRYLSDSNIEPITDEYEKQTISLLDWDTAQDCSIFGRAYNYNYTNSKGNKKTARIDPRNCIVVYDNTLELNPLFAIMYETSTENTHTTDQNGDTLVRRLEVVDKDYVYKYNVDSVKWQVSEKTRHFYGEVPVIEFWNNNQLQGDFDQVKTLIDAYNFLQSDRVNDKEQLVESILGLYGFGLTADQKEDLMTYRTLTDLPVDGKAEYITKTFDEQQVQVLLDSIEQDIHKISMTPNMSDKDFAGNSSGVALAYKLLPFENNIKSKQRIFEQGLRDRFKQYNNQLKFESKMEDIDYSDFAVVFNRALPKNDLETSQIISNLRGVVSQGTLISQLSFVKDPEQEIEDVSKEGLNGMSAELPEYGTPEATIETLEEKGMIDATAKQDSLLTKLKNLLN